MTVPANDLRADAIVVTPDSSGHYGTMDINDSSAIDLTDATPADRGGTGPYLWDTEAEPLYNTVWWKYVPEADGYCTVAVTTTPMPGSPQFQTTTTRVIMIHDNAGTLEVVGFADIPDLYSDNVVGGETYYFAVGITSSVIGCPSVVFLLQYSPPVIIPSTGPLTIHGLTTKDLAAAASNSWLWKMNDDTYGWVDWVDGASDPQTLKFRDQSDDLYLTFDDVTWPRFQGTQWHVTFESDGPEITVDIENSNVDMTVTLSQSSVSVRTGWNSPSAGMGYRTDELSGTYPYFRVVRNVWPDGCDGVDTGGFDRFEVLISEDGYVWYGIAASEPEATSTDWKTNAAATGYPIVDPDTGGSWNLHLTIGGYTNIVEVKGCQVTAHICGTDPNSGIPDFDPGIDNFVPYIPQVIPVDNTKTTATLYSLIQAFFGKVKRSGRIIAVDTVPDQSRPLVLPYATVEMVNRAAKNQMQILDPADIYTSAEDTYTLGQYKVSLLSADQVRTCKASFKNNDVSILVSGWQLPDALPMPTINSQTPALKPVQSVQYTFTPESFTGSVVFYPN